MDQEDRLDSILIIDDNARQREILEQQIGGDEHNIVSMRSGKNALDYLHNNEVSMIVSDLYMPEMDGLKLCQNIRVNPNLCQLPYVLYTAVPLSADQARFAYDCGVDLVLDRTLEREAFLALITDIIADPPDHKPLDSSAYSAARVQSGRDDFIRQLEHRILDLDSTRKSLEHLQAQLEEQQRELQSEAEFAMVDHTSKLLYNKLHARHGHIEGEAEGLHIQFESEQLNELQGLLTELTQEREDLIDELASVQQDISTLTAALDLIDGHLAVLDPKHRILRANKLFRQDFLPEDWDGKPVAPPAGFSATLPPGLLTRALIPGNDPDQIHTWNSPADGTGRSARIWRGRAVYNSSGIQEWVLIYSSITPESSMISPVSEEPVQVADTVPIQTLEPRRMVAEPDSLPSGLPVDLIGSGYAFTTFLKQLNSNSSSDAPLVIVGEPGSGRQLAARYIHQNKVKKDLNFKPVYCQLIAEQQFRRQITILFQQSDTGVLCLLEPGSLSRSAQRYLLDTMTLPQNGPSSSLRIISVTSLDLPRLVEERSFNADLWDLLSENQITVPALRDRREDIPALVNHFVRRFTRQYHRSIHNIPLATVDEMQQYHWPGNIRELSQIVEHAVLRSTGTSLQFGGGPFSGQLGLGGAAPFASLKDMEREYIRSVLDHTRWIIHGSRGAARILEMHPNTLRSRMEKLGLHKSKRPRN